MLDIFIGQNTMKDNLQVKNYLNLNAYIHSFLTSKHSFLYNKYTVRFLIQIKDDGFLRTDRSTKGEEEKRNLIFIPSSSDIYVVGLFPVHFTSENGKRPVINEPFKLQKILLSLLAFLFSIKG